MYKYFHLKQNNNNTNSTHQIELHILTAINPSAFPKKVVNILRIEMEIK